ncbi:hypothetical protein [Sporosarcina ureilytica]|uniref:hypothetical protein n=1 Tax=Sporosarcina ureilytica TaxID=298596 RepID=UPI0012DB67D8|nr:hypothetical protein [Sporosarcina ureilytica]
MADLPSLFLLTSKMPENTVTIFIMFIVLIIIFRDIKSLSSAMFKVTILLVIIQAFGRI